MSRLLILALFLCSAAGADPTADLIGREQVAYPSLAQGLSCAGAPEPPARMEPNASPVQKECLGGGAPAGKILWQCRMACSCAFEYSCGDESVTHWVEISSDNDPLVTPVCAAKGDCVDRLADAAGRTKTCQRVCGRGGARARLTQSACATCGGKEPQARMVSAIAIHLGPCEAGRAVSCQ